MFYYLQRNDLHDWIFIYLSTIILYAYTDTHKRAYLDNFMGQKWIKSFCRFLTRN
eukprot:TRINITY_DN2944_c0_g1_i1.p1 TRINITY_DN2944_c0_g1~~TRINITY_DN2944_c0_g1_i1.p1  ORF type:complete len:55 (-),score=1.33 TRINITY_DN2944_c0_g1_i1:66-230(-)